MSFLWKIPLGLIFLIGAFCLVTAWTELISAAGNQLLPELYFGVGAGGMLVIYFLFRSRLQVWHTLEHEITHAIVATLLFRRVDKISASGGSGITRFEGRGSLPITLAPYALPTLALVPVILHIVAAPEYYPVVNVLLGSAFGYYLVSNLLEAHPAQPDLQRFGLLFSYLLVLPTHFFLLSLIYLLHLRGTSLVSQFTSDFLYTYSDTVVLIREWLQQGWQNLV